MPQEIEQLLKAVTSTSRRAARSRDQRNEAIYAAHAAGATFRAIATAADLSVGAIHKIVRSKP